VGAAAATHEEAEQLIREAIALHVQGLAEDGVPIPDPHSVDVGQVELRQPA
jgi:predicted RNase H-like HicB family nuclease